MEGPGDGTCLVLVVKQAWHVEAPIQQLSSKGWQRCSWEEAGLTAPGPDEAA